MGQVVQALAYAPGGSAARLPIDLFVAQAGDEPLGFTIGGVKISKDLQ